MVLESPYWNLGPLNEGASDWRSEDQGSNPGCTSMPSLANKQLFNKTSRVHNCYKLLKISIYKSRCFIHVGVDTEEWGPYCDVCPGCRGRWYTAALTE